MELAFRNHFWASHPLVSSWQRGVVLVCFSIWMVWVPLNAALAGAPEFDIPNWTVDNGGGHSNGLEFSLEGTLGQPDVGTLANGDFEIRGGFWEGTDVLGVGTPTPPPTATPTPTNTPLEPSRTPTPTQVPCDSGLYVLDSFGGRHPVGTPPIITGPVFFSEPIGKDMEIARCSVAGASEDDLVVLDGMGAVHFVMHPECSIDQDFYFGDQITDFPEGRAVDIEVSAGGRGLWVLTDFGGIYRAGTTLQPGQSARVSGPGLEGMLGYDSPIPKEVRFPELAANDGSSLYAVALVVIDTDSDSLAEGYVVLDTMGGQFRYDPEGNPIEEGFSASFPLNDPRKLLDPIAYVWPFFPGLDIARDMELHPTHQGVVILDGWGGIHPVPVEVESNPVYFANNRVSESDPSPVYSTGMPYVTAGFDNPGTVADESDPSVAGPDTASIFKDLEFSYCSQGFYVLDQFGGVFAFGGSRLDPEDVLPKHQGAPYFFPYQFAEDQEVFQGR